MLIGGILVITRKNAVHSALALISTLLAQAGLYLMLYAPFVAGVQIILYAGGIMVLFLFVIMLVNHGARAERAPVQQAVVGGHRCRGALGGLFISIYTKGKGIFPDRTHCPRSGGGQHARHRETCSYGQYMFAFEIASLLLLVAIIGAVVMAKKRI